MLIEIGLLEYLAYKTGCPALSDLPKFPLKSRLQREISTIPLQAYEEREWLDASHYLTGQSYSSATEAKNSLIR